MFEACLGLNYREGFVCYFKVFGFYFGRNRESLEVLKQDIDMIRYDFLKRIFQIEKMGGVYWVGSREIFEGVVIKLRRE